jgi:hypothetical protein
MQSACNPEVRPYRQPDGTLLLEIAMAIIALLLPVIVAISVAVYKWQRRLLANQHNMDAISDASFQWSPLKHLKGSFPMCSGA